MSVAWILLVAATGVLPADSSQPATSSSVATDVATTVAPANRSTKDLRRVVADTLHRANAAKGADRVSTVAALVDLFKELGNDRQLSPPERQRLGVEIRSRLLRFAAQFQHEISRAAQQLAADSDGIAGAARGPRRSQESCRCDSEERRSRGLGIGSADWRAGRSGASGCGGWLSNRRRIGCRQRPGPASRGQRSSPRRADPRHGRPRFLGYPRRARLDRLFQSPAMPGRATNRRGARRSRRSLRGCAEVGGVGQRSARRDS